MTNLKHVGRLKNTGDRVIIIFRELLDGDGNTTDPDHALVVYPDRLQDRYHDRVLDLLESDRAQQTENFFEVLHSRTFHDGNNMLTFLHQQGFLKKVQVDNVVLCPNTHERIALRDYNESLENNNPNAAHRLQDYVDEKQRKTASNQQKTNEQVTVTADDIMGQQNSTPQHPSDASPEEQAKAMLTQAHIMEEERNMLDREISKKKDEAYRLNPSLKPQATSESSDSDEDKVE